MQDGTPHMDFSLGEGECTFCGDCTSACPTAALDADRARPWDWVADAGAKCLSSQGITCRACQDACEPRAIRFSLMTGGRAIPLIDEYSCTGCGACAGVCPAGAIRFSERAGQTAELTQ
jgi:ferredoxin-type protein NapF